MCLDLRREAFRFPRQKNSITAWTTAHAAALFQHNSGVSESAAIHLSLRDRDCIMSDFYSKNIYYDCYYLPSSTLRPSHHPLSPTKR